MPRVIGILEITSNGLCQADCRTLGLRIKQVNKVGRHRRSCNSRKKFTSGFASESCERTAATRLERVHGLNNRNNALTNVMDTRQCDLSQWREEMQNSVHLTVRLIGKDTIALEAVCELVRSIGLRVHPYRSLDEFQRQQDATQPGCLVADLGITGMNGIEILQELNETDSPLPAIFVASHAKVADVVNLMQSGAVTLLEKPFQHGRLLDAIRSAVRLDSERRSVAARCRELDQHFRELSEDERHVLRDLLAGKTNKQIAFDLGTALRTVEYRRSSILSKLKVQSIAEAAATVAELERLTDISALLKAPPIRLTDSRLTSFGMPMWMRTLGSDHTTLSPPHSGPSEPVRRKKLVQSRVAK